MARWLLSIILVVAPCAAHAEKPNAVADLFVDRAEELGVDFVNFAGVSGEFYIVEISGPGCGMLDYDNDGDLDLYLIQGAMLGPGKTVADAILPPQKGHPLRDRLYRNDLVVAEDGTRTLAFTDVTEASGIRADGYGVGVTVADYDNDGWVDIFLTNFGPNQLWRNTGKGTFEEVIAKAGIDDPRWNSGATFLDFDHDGWLDLFVGCYLDFSFEKHAICRLPSGVPGYCAPEAYAAVTNRLYRNRGDGTFEDWSLKAGISTGGWMCMSPTTCFQTTCGSTRATAPSSTTVCSGARRSMRTGVPSRAWGWMPPTSTAMATRTCS
jgi:hypothetical protein